MTKWEQYRNGRELYYFSIDKEFVYWNFFLDFGPLNLGHLYRFCAKLNRLLVEKRDTHTIVFYSSSHNNRRANAIYLICAWQIMYLNRTPEEAFCGFNAALSSTGASDDQRDHDECYGVKTTTTASSSSSNPPKIEHALTVAPLRPFHDASPYNCTFDLTVLDVLRGLAKAKQYNFFDFKTFDVEEYEFYEQVEHGDLNWIVKDRIVAFAGPHARRNLTADDGESGSCTLTPQDYIEYFLDHEVDLVVRLNKKVYSEAYFEDAGIHHYEQYYPDGSCPPMKVLHKILEQFEKSNVFAVHCKAGLGRTGTCIGAFLMKHYKLTASEAIGWMRVCRPGMVIGPQQHFLQDIEQRMWHEGSVMKLKPTQDVKLLRITPSSSSAPSSSCCRKITKTKKQWCDACDHDDKKEEKKKTRGCCRVKEEAGERSPTSVYAAPFDMGELSSSLLNNPPSSGNNGRPGQAKELLARRNIRRARR